MLSERPWIRSAVFFSIVIGMFLFSMCSRQIHKIVYPTLSDGKYDTEFPYRNCSSQLEEISRSVMKLNYMVYYNSYLFSENNPLIESQLSTRNLRKHAVSDTITMRTGSGTATVIYRSRDRIALLTCAHVVSHPDTVLSYFHDNKEKGRRIIQTVSVKIQQQYYVVDIPDGGDLEIIHADRKRDIAVIGKDRVRIDDFIPVFGFPIGESKNLEWGSFVYLIGYPMGYKMITRGIVSSPDMDKTGAFLVDALFNRGFSGGVILAIKDGVPNFELVGLTKSVSADYKYVLQPLKEKSEDEYNPNVPYTEDISVRMETDINYGVTHAISTEAIRAFFRENKEEFQNKGYYFTKLFE